MQTDSWSRALVAEAPTRLDFGGGWTDVPPYPEERGGFVCNIAITRYATVRLSQSASAYVNAHRSDVTPALVRAALDYHGVRDAAVSLTSDFPVNAGLGGSSAAGVALSAALRALKEEDVLAPESRALVAESSRAIEVEQMGIAGGRQDHYAAAFGGALGIEFGATTTATHIPLTQPAIQALERRCIVGYTGQSRISGITITAVIDGFRERKPHIVHALDSMKQLAYGMRDALAAGDIDLLAKLVDEHWTHQRSLHPAITTPRIDALERAVRDAGAIGLKALGASGGGCVMVFAAEGAEDAVQKAMYAHAEPVAWHVAHEGVAVREETGVMPAYRRPK